MSRTNPIHFCKRVPHVAEVRLDRFGLEPDDHRASIFAPRLAAFSDRVEGLDGATDEIRDYLSRPIPQVKAEVNCLADCTLAGCGWVIRDGQVLLPAGVFPNYLVSALTKIDYSSVWMQPLAKQEFETVTESLPVIVCMHPNMIYGHFLLEMLPRLLLAKSLVDRGFDCLVAWSIHSPEWSWQYVTALFGSDRILRYDHTQQRIKARFLVAPSMLHSDYQFHPQLNALLNLLPGFSSATEYEPGVRLFLSRSAHTNARQGIANWKEVEHALSEAGFTIVSPEKLTLAEQFRLFGRTKLVVSDYNSSIHNSLFMREGSIVVSLNWLNWYQMGVCSLREQPLIFMPPADGRYRTWRSRGTPDAWYHVNIARLLARLESL